MLNTLFDKIDFLYKEITSVEENARISFPQSMELHQEMLDYSYLYEDFKVLLSNVLDVYKCVFRSSFSEKAKKVYYVAICEMIKQDFYRGMLITFRNITNCSNLNTAKYYDLLGIITKSQGLSIDVVNGRRQFEKAFILETGIPKNMSKHVMKMFKIYWRYFRELPNEERKQILFHYLQGNEFSQEYIIDQQEADLFEKYREEIIDYAEKVYSVICRLDDIFSVLDDYYNLTDEIEGDLFVDDINRILGYDITKVLRDSDIKSIFSAYLKTVTISKFKKILNNLPQSEHIQTPAGYTLTANRVCNNIVCGIYKVRGNHYEVVIDPTISLEEMLDMVCDKVHALAIDYYCYVSRDYFDIEVDGKTVYPRELLYRGESRYIWIGKISDAGRVEIDGHVLLSSKKSKISGKIIKQYNRESQKSELVYYLQSVKVNDPTKPYGRLTYKIENGESGLICVGNNLGIYYRENLRIPWDVDINIIDIYIDDRLIEEISVECSDMFLFDKWNGTQYFSEKENDKHSGSMILFSKDGYLLDQTEIEIINRYTFCQYYVTEFKIAYNKKELHVGRNIFSFEGSKSPYYFFRSEIGTVDLIDDISEIIVKFVNLKTNSVYWFDVENEMGRFRKAVSEGEISLSELFSDEKIDTCGKWYCSLWEKQKKIKSDDFVVIPNIHYQQEDFCVLEGKDIHLRITANEECFIGSTGAYSNTTTINIGCANIDIVQENLAKTVILVNVYIDKWDTCKELQVFPSVWGIRVKKQTDNSWVKVDTIDFNPELVAQTKCAIFSTGPNTIYINGEQTDICEGETEIDWYKLVGNTYSRRNEVIFTDGSFSYKQIFVCMPHFSVYDTSIKEEAVLSIRYVGPTSEILTIRYFIDGLLEKTFLRDTIKNTFLIHVLLGKSKALINKRIAVDIANNTSYMPIEIIDDILVDDQFTKQVDPLIEDTVVPYNEMTRSSVKITHNDLLNIDKVSEYFFGECVSPSDIPLDVKALVNMYREV